MYVRSKIPLQILQDSCSKSCKTLVWFLHARLCTVHILHGSKTCKIIARSCKIIATSLAICKIFEQVYKILLQDVSDFDASQPASFLQEPYVWVHAVTSILYQTLMQGMLTIINPLIMLCLSDSIIMPCVYVCN